MENKIPTKDSEEIEKLRLDTRNRELDIEEKKLDRKFELHRQGLMSGSVGVGLSFVAVLFLISVAYYNAPPNQPVFAGWHIVAIIFILVGGVVLYFSLVFWREVKLSAEISEKGIKLDGGTGGTANDT